jgi:hypothetical protein
MAASKGRRRQEWRTIRNMAESPAFVKPASLPATVDGIEIDVYSLPPVKLYRLNQDGTPAKVSCNWDHSPLSIKWVQTQTGKGFSLATKNALVAAKLLSEQQVGAGRKPAPFFPGIYILRPRPIL